MKNMYILKKTTVVAVMLVLTLALIGCGKENSEGKLKPLLKSINNEKGINIDFEGDDSGDNLKFQYQSKGKKVYALVEFNGEKMIFIADGENNYLLNPQAKTGKKEAGAEALIKDPFLDVYKALEKAEIEKGEYEYKGKKYSSEAIEGDTQKRIFLFDGDKLAFMITKKQGAEESLKINSMSNKVEESKFKLPEGYKIED